MTADDKEIERAMKYIEESARLKQLILAKRLMANTFCLCSFILNDEYGKKETKRLLLEIFEECIDAVESGEWEKELPILKEMQ